MMRFEESVESLPMREAGRFKAKNLKWTAKDYKSYADSHANALLEFRFKKGDKVAVWMAPCDHKVFSYSSPILLRPSILHINRRCIWNTSKSASWPTRKWAYTFMTSTLQYPASRMLEHFCQRVSAKWLYFLQSLKTKITWEFSAMQFLSYSTVSDWYSQILSSTDYSLFPIAVL